MVAPLPGTVVDLGDVPDPVFAGKIIGPGVAILPEEPTTGLRLVVVAPCSGRLMSAYPHAVIVEADEYRAVLVHLGVDTDDLAEACFDVAVQEGEEVVAGQPLLAWSPECVREIGRSTLCPVVTLQAAPSDVELLVAPGETVTESQALLSWSRRPDR